MGDFGPVHLGGPGDQDTPGTVPGAGDRYIAQEQVRHSTDPGLPPTQDEGDRGVSGNSQAGRRIWDAGSAVAAGMRWKKLNMA